MSNILNRTTRQYFMSRNTPDFPIADWIINPDVSTVIAFDTKYWIITGDVVTLMDLTARNAVDAAETTARLDGIADEIDRAETYSKGFAEVVMDEVNILRGNHSLADRTLAQLKTAVRGKL